jgi:sugar phosphate isomerase/epimerase
MTRLAFSTLNHSTLFREGTTMADQIVAAASAGFPLLSPDFFAIRSYVKEGGTLAELAELQRRHGIESYDVAGLTVSDDDATTRREAEELLGIAEALSAEWVQVRVTEQIDQVVRDRYAWCRDALAEAGLGVAVEFSPYTVIRSIDDAQDLLSTSGAPSSRGGVIVDSFHFYRGDSTWEELDALSLDDIAFVQFDDALPPGNDSRADTLHRRALPGEGELDLARFAARLRDRGFEGVVSVEVLAEHDRDDPVEAFARRCLQTTEPYWS